MKFSLFCSFLYFARSNCCLPVPEQPAPLTSSGAGAGREMPLLLGPAPVAEVLRFSFSG